ncbi:MAG: hypothetical protein LBL85_06615 [Methanocalculaceae archaeon]|jgi:hypothetical protein|nr:hypothetical protein [Methanocalculaceae archaeon]
MKDNAGYNFLNVTKYPTYQHADETFGISAPVFVTSPQNGTEMISLPDPDDGIMYQISPSSCGVPLEDFA